MFAHGFSSFDLEVKAVASRIYPHSRKQVFRALARDRSRQLGSLLIPLGLWAPTVNALPSFARQTGEDCASCHVGGFGPQLTPHGSRFKLSGYTDTDGKSGKLPFSAMAVGSWTQISKDLSEDAGPHNGPNDNASLDEAAVFLAGRLSDKVGSFTQVTYSGVDRNVALDNMDVRYALPLTLAGKDSLIGVTVNNNPTVTDPFNTLPAWRFPYAASELAPGGAAAPLIVDGLGQQVVGASIYAFWNDMLYAEAGGYRSLSHQSLRALGASDELGRTPGLTSYWRLAYLNDRRWQNFTAGVFGLNSRIQPDRIDGPENKYNDVGVDASYQFLGTREHIASIYSSYIHEDQKLNASYANGDAADRTGRLSEFLLNVSYYYDQTWGLTVGRFDTKGSRDAGLYAAEPDGGSRLASPNTAGYIVQADWSPWGKEDSWNAPWANLRLGAQYVIYQRFNGAEEDYDGAGRDASDNNTLFLFAWTSF
jgi:hypothetical protein